MLFRSRNPSLAAALRGAPTTSIDLRWVLADIKAQSTFKRLLFLVSRISKLVVSVAVGAHQRRLPLPFPRRPRIDPPLLGLARRHSGPRERLPLAVLQSTATSAPINHPAAPQRTYQRARVALVELIQKVAIGLFLKHRPDPERLVAERVRRGDDQGGRQVDLRAAACGDWVNPASRGGWRRAHLE